MIAHVSVTARCKVRHAFAPDAFVAYGARFLARGGDIAVVEGRAFDHHVVIDYPDILATRACDTSPEYCAAWVAGDGAYEAMMVPVDGFRL